jgi:hypothetical protein
MRLSSLGPRLERHPNDTIDMNAGLVCGSKGSADGLRGVGKRLLLFLEVAFGVWFRFQVNETWLLTVGLLRSSLALFVRDGLRHGPF